MRACCLSWRACTQVCTFYLLARKLQPCLELHLKSLIVLIWKGHQALIVEISTKLQLVVFKAVCHYLNGSAWWSYFLPIWNVLVRFWFFNVLDFQQIAKAVWFCSIVMWILWQNEDHARLAYSQVRIFWLGWNHLVVIQTIRWMIKYVDFVAKRPGNHQMTIIFPQLSHPGWTCQRKQQQQDSLEIKQQQGGEKFRHW